MNISYLRTLNQFIIAAQILSTTKLAGRRSSIHNFYDGVICIPRITIEYRDTLPSAFLQPCHVYIGSVNHLNHVIVD